MPKAQETVLEIDLKALKHHFGHLKSKLKDTTKFLAVVKAFGYGSDAIEVAQWPPRRRRCQFCRRRGDRGELKARVSLHFFV